MTLIDTMVDTLESMDAERIAVHPERCVSVRDRNVHCQRCVESCSSGALHVDENGISCDAGKCIGCGTCATACPSSAIEIIGPSDKQIVESLRASIVATKGHPIVACDRASAAYDLPESSVVVPCLGRVDETLIAATAAYGSRDLRLTCYDCAHCDHAPGGRMCARVVESARNLIEACGSKMTVTMAEADELFAKRDDAGDEERTATMETTTETAAAASTTEADFHLEKVNDRGTLSHHMPTRRTLLFNYLRHIAKTHGNAHGKADGTNDRMVSQRVFGNVTIDQNACMSCRMCTVFCPTGALSRVDEPDWGVQHQVVACTQCRSCEQICPKEAIKVSGSVPLRHVLDEGTTFWKMDENRWVPNKPDSMYKKYHHLIGDDLEMGMF